MRHQSRPSAVSATPATQSERRCHQVPRKVIHVASCRQVPRLPRKVTVDVTKCHACHAKSRGVHASFGNPVRHQRRPSAVSATTASQSERRCHMMSPSATPATQSEGPCRPVQRLPRKELRRPRRHLGTRCGTRASPVPCHACHAK